MCNLHAMKSKDSCWCVYQVLAVLLARPSNKYHITTSFKKTKIGPETEYLEGGSLGFISK